MPSFVPFSLAYLGIRQTSKQGFAGKRMENAAIATLLALYACTTNCSSIAEDVSILFLFY